MNFLCGLNLAGVNFPKMELHIEDSLIILSNTVISGFSMSCGESRRRAPGCSISLNFTSISQKTTSSYRRPISVPAGINQNGIRQPHHEFRALGPTLFSYLTQQDLWHCAQVCVLWLHCANDKSLLKQRTHEWSYDLTSAKASLDGFRLPKLTKDDDDNNRYGGNNDDDNVDENEKAEIKAQEEIEQGIIREDLKKSPFAFLFPTPKPKPLPEKTTSTSDQQFFFCLKFIILFTAMNVIQKP